MYMEKNNSGISEIDTETIPTSFLESVDLEAVKRLQERGMSRHIKRKWIKRGYTRQISLYGAIYNHDDDKHYYRRYEVLSNVPYTQRLIYILYEFFEVTLPPYAYSIWIYDQSKESVGLVAYYD